MIPRPVKPPGPVTREYERELDRWRSGALQRGEICPVCLDEEPLRAACEQCRARRRVEIERVAREELAEVLGAESVEWRALIEAGRRRRDERKEAVRIVSITARAVKDEPIPFGPPQVAAEDYRERVQIESLRAEAARLRNERNQIAGALALYGRHRPGCEAGTVHRAGCSCGLDKLKREIEGC